LESLHIPEMFMLDDAKLRNVPRRLLVRDNSLLENKKNNIGRNNSFVTFY